MLRGTDAFLAELGLEHAEPTGYEWGDDPGSQTRRAGPTHEVLHRMLESAEALAPFLKLTRGVVFDLLCDLVIEEAERSPFGLVPREQVAEAVGEPATLDSMGLQELLAQAARMADTRLGRPRAPEWAVPLDRCNEPDGSDL